MLRGIAALGRVVATIGIAGRVSLVMSKVRRELLVFQFLAFVKVRDWTGRVVHITNVVEDIGGALRSSLLQVRCVK